MMLLGRKSAPEKIATFLLDMSERLADNGCMAHTGPAKHFTLPFSRQQVADLLGLTIETVSRQFTKLKADGVVALPGRRDVEILDRAALQTLAG
jgi:CRP/FNR family transcriptional regulator